MKKNHLQFTNLKTLLIVALMLLSVTWVHSATINITASTNWSAISPAPTSADDIVVAKNATLTVNVSNGLCNSITLGLSAGNKEGHLVFSANSQVTVSGNVQFQSSNGNNSITMTNGGTLISQGFTGSTNVTFTPGTGTIVLTATNTLPTWANNFNNLSISGGTTTLGTSVSVGGTLLQSGGNIAVGSNALTVNGTHNAGTYTVTGTGTYTLSSGATLITANLAGITTSGATGTIQTNTRNYNTAANYRFDGAADQVTGNGLPATVTSFRVQNTGNCYLKQCKFKRNYINDRCRS